MRFQAIIQIFLLIIAVVIAVTVIRPKLNDMRNTQSDIESYKTALENIGAYNNRLQALLSQANSFSDEQKEALDRYLPTEIDATEVSRDITNVVDNNNLLLLDVTVSEEQEVLETVGSPSGISIEGEEFGGVIEDGSQAPSGLVAHQFTVRVVGLYADMKNMLADFERNIYPLRVVQVNFDAADSDLVEYAVVLEAYSLPIN